MQIEKPLVVYIPDTRGVTLSRYGRGNFKIGLGVYTFSRLPGDPSKAALGAASDSWRGTCPGATAECQEICYARRPVAELGPVASMWLRNTMQSDVPPIPEDATLLRLHVSGDFDSEEYIGNWITRLLARPDVKCWVYTRSWRVPGLLRFLEALRALPNVQMFASMDPSCDEMPPEGWRRSWIWRERPTDVGPAEHRLRYLRADGETLVYNGASRSTKYNGYNQVAVDGAPSLVCPEETGKAKNCEECRYCFDGQRNDVTFLEH